MKSGKDEFLLKPKGKVKGRVLLLHGFSASPFEVKDLGLHLQKKGYFVYGPRLAGHGRTRSEFDKAGVNEWIADAEKAFASLRKAGEKIILIGHSAGGVLAAMLAARYAGEVAALVMGAPAFKLSSPKAALTLFAPIRLLIPTLKFSTSNPESKNWTTEYASHRLAELIWLGRLGRIDALNLKVPVLLLQAKTDDQTSRPFNEGLFKKIPSQRKKMIIYDCAEHNVFHHSNPLQKRVFAWVDAFLSSKFID